MQEKIIIYNKQSMILYYLAGADVIMYSMLVLNIQGSTKVTSVEFLTETKVIITYI